MIGLGTWTAKLDTPLLRDMLKFKISDVDGKYEIRAGFSDDLKFKPEIVECTENGNTLILTLVARRHLQNYTIPVEATFSDDTFTGFCKLPLMGKIKIIDGRRAPDAE